MSGLFTSLTNVAQALDAQRFGLDVVAQNLTNANTPGYSKRNIVLEEVPPIDAQGAGNGVRVLDVTAARTPLIDGRLYRERPAAEREAAVVDQLAVVESALGTPGTSIDARLTEFYDAFAALADDPTSTSARQGALAHGQSVAQAFQDLAAQLSSAQRNADTDIRDTVDQINVLSRKIAALNVAIGSAGTGSTDSLRDQQATALQSLAGLIDIAVIPRSNGGADVTVGNGLAIVTAENSYALTSVPTGTQGFSQVFAGTTDLTAEITGGRLGGLIVTRDVLVAGYRQGLDDVAFNFASDVNALHRAGLDLNGAAGGNFFTQPALAAGAAAAMAVNPTVAANGRLIAAGRTAAGDNQTARAIAALREGNPSASDRWGTLVHRVGTDRSTALSNLSTSKDILSQLESLRSQISGVSIDEEAASMLRFQRAYEANARFFNVVNGLFDTLMSNVG